MLRELLLVLTALVAAAGCPAGDGGIGDSCSGNDDCSGDLQCVSSLCMPQCERGPDCGDGYSCHEGHCVVAHQQLGDNCKSEVDCEAGLSCRILGSEIDPADTRLVANCADENPTRAAGDLCSSEADCRSGTCELGHCVDLCQVKEDCPKGLDCMTIPHVAANGSFYAGCLPEQGTITWSIPVTSPSAEIVLPIPSRALSAELVMSVDDATQMVGAARVLDPCGCTRFAAPCPFGPTPDGKEACSERVAGDQFFSVPGPLGTGTGTGVSSCNPQSRCNEDGRYRNTLRHLPALGQSVLLMPSDPSGGQFTPGAHQIQVSSFWPDGSIGTAIPHVTAVVRIAPEEISGRDYNVDLHFFFLDLTDHPCLPAGVQLNAALAAPTTTPFDQFFSPLQMLFSRYGVGVHATTFEDVSNHHELDALDVSQARNLLALGHYADGINVFFVRSLSPLGLSTYSAEPGPAGVAGTAGSGIIVALDALCQGSWSDLARLTAHQIGRYMGLYHNVEPKDPSQDVCAAPWQDLIEDSDLTSDNLMYFSDQGGTQLSIGQLDVLIRSGVLR